MSDPTKFPFDHIPLDGGVSSTAALAEPRPAFSRSAVDYPDATGGLLPPTRKPVGVTVPDPAPTPPAEAAPAPLGSTPPPKAGSVRGFIWDLVRPTRTKWAILAGGVSLVAGAYGLNLFVPGPSAAPPSPKKSAEVARAVAHGDLPPPQVGVERQAPPPKVDVERTPVVHTGYIEPAPLPTVPTTTLPLPDASKPVPVPVEPAPGPLPLPKPVVSADPPPLPPVVMPDNKVLPLPDSKPLPPPVMSADVPKPAAFVETPAEKKPDPLPLPTFNEKKAEPVALPKPDPIPAPKMDFKPAGTDTGTAPLPVPALPAPGEVVKKDEPIPALPPLPPVDTTIPKPDPKLLVEQPRPDPVPRPAPFVEEKTTPAVPVLGAKDPPTVTATVTPPRRGFEVDVVKVRPTDTYTTISEAFYQSRKHAAALRAFNGNADIGQLQEVEVPPLFELQKISAKPQPGEPGGAVVRGTTPDPAVRGPVLDGTADAGETADWGPAGKRRPTTKFERYTTPKEGMTPREVARAVYADEGEWPKLLGPRGTRLRADDPLPRGTELTVPREELAWK